MTLPRWVPILVGALVGLFGLYRMRLAFRSQQEDERARQQGGLYGHGKRTHLLFGVVYLLMGAMLILSGFGISIFPPRAK
jgi:hypothetical protein